jgi:1,4-alpha-glucan branching enzyme
MIKKQELKGKKQVKVTFSLPLEEIEDKTAVVGDFNGWDPTKNRLVKRSNGTASVAVTLKAGQEYAFRYVSENGKWMNDEEADKVELSPLGTKNSVVLT